MAKHYKTATVALLSLLAFASYAAIPVRWTTDAYKVKPLVYECYHGETLDMAAALTAYGDPLNFAGKTAKLYWQTNGMASAWWSTNAFVRTEAGATNVLSAIWSGAYDTGAASVTGFIGVEGENYRAAFTLNFRPSPGFAPSAIPIPPKAIDWAKVSNENVDAAPFALKGSGGGGVTTNDVRGIVEGYGYVTKVVTNGLESSSHATATYQPKGNYLTSESDPTAYSKITNAVSSGYLCTVEAARGMTNNNIVVRYETRIVVDEEEENEVTGLWHGDEKVTASDVGALSYNSATETAYPVNIVADGDITVSSFANIRVNGTETTDLQTKLSAKANANAVYTKTEINGATVTNGGAVAAARAYANAKFLPMENTLGEISWIDTGLMLTAQLDMSGTLMMTSFDDIADVNGNVLSGLLSEKANVSDLATVATSGNYNDLIDRPTIPSPVSDSHITNIAEAVNATTRAIVATWENFLDGSNVVFSITNYISGTYNLDAAKLRIMEMTNGVYREVYNSRDEILLHIDDFKNTDFRVATNQVIQGVSAAIADKADKAWGKYTSAGGEAPSNTVYMTAPNTVFAGGLEYERVAVGEGAVCILTTKGAPVWTQGDEGTFKFQDDGGTNYFGFAKTDSYVIGCNTDGITVQNTLVTLRYDLTMSGVPCIWYKANLASNTAWEQLNLPDGTAVPGASHVVSWEQNPPAGQELCYINCPEAKGFFKATIEVSGDAKFMTNMPADLGGGILCTNTATGVNGVIKPTYNGSSVSWSWENL